tara:strand:- start:327 stop:500 length:174 start_codon:yes stop_codon:yes gene_type:complete
MQVEQLAARIQYLKTMRTGLGDQQSVGTLWGELNSMPLAKSAGIPSKIYRYIPHPSL